MVAASSSSGNGKELLQPDDRHVRKAGFATRFEQIVVDPAAAQNEAFHAVRVDLVHLAEHAPEAAVGDILERRGGELVAQQALRRQHDQRLAHRADHLAAQQVEHLRGRGRQADLDVALRRELQVALEPRRGMLRALALVAVRQQHHEAAEPLPLGLPLTTNWSITTWAPLAKSPNCASQITSVPGDVEP